MEAFGHLQADVTRADDDRILWPFMLDKVAGGEAIFDGAHDEHAAKVVQGKVGQQSGPATGGNE